MSGLRNQPTQYQHQITMIELIPLLLIIFLGYVIYQIAKGKNTNLPRFKTTNSDLAWLWCLIFTPTIYFFFLGLDKLALRCFFWTIITFGIAHIYYVFVANSLVYEYQKGLRKDY